MDRIQCLACDDEKCISGFGKCTNAIACYEFNKVHPDGVKEIRKGCLTSEHLVRHQCPLDSVPRHHTTCCYTEFCNDSVHTSITPDPPSWTNRQIIIYGSFAIIGLVVILALLICFLVRKIRKRKETSKDPEQEDTESYHKETFKDYEASETSGSGLGLPLLSNRTVSREIKLIGRFYRGRSTEVWKGRWLGHSVAVKVFYTRDEHLFNRELAIYRSINGHPNILEFMAADCTSVESCTQLWLITTYYELGSLYDYLNRYSIDYFQCLSILLDIVNGLDFLHAEDKFPQIAHRDLKSKNILMKNHYNACIADFGLSCAMYEDRKIVHAEKYTVGTIRYMPPEVLSDTFDMADFRGHKQADIYSLSLVMWETASRCGPNGDKIDDYCLPFAGLVPSDPTLEEMKKVVCAGVRPAISERMSKNPVISKICDIVQECWRDGPTKRLTSLRVKKSLLKIQVK